MSFQILRTIAMLALLLAAGTADASERDGEIILFALDITKADFRDIALEVDDPAEAKFWSMATDQSGIRSLAEALSIPALVSMSPDDIKSTHEFIDSYAGHKMRQLTIQSSSVPEAIEKVKALPEAERIAIKLFTASAAFNKLARNINSPETRTAVRVWAKDVACGFSSVTDDNVRQLAAKVCSSRP